MSDALAAEETLGRSVVATAIADPLAVTLKKSLLVFINALSIGFGHLASRNRHADSQRLALACLAPIEMNVPSKD